MYLSIHHRKCIYFFSFTKEWEESNAIGVTTFVILKISVIFNIFLFCYIGELLSTECASIGETIYMIDWYRLPEKKAFCLTLMIATAQNPVTITAGKFPLSLKSFCNVVRTSVAYLNLLRTRMM